jgi:hypothetical protein
MGEWKAPLSLRIRQALRVELEELALRERRTLGNIGELLLECGLEQLKAAGSLERMLSMLDGRSVRESRSNAVQTSFRTRSK